ncbi:MAG: MATE family efflux transporter [Culicoidibacterales bacterium]
MKSSNTDFLGTAPLGKVLMQMSAPMVVGFVVQALYNIVDTMFVGQSVGAIGIGALGIAFPLQIILMALGGLIGAGSAVIISVELGKKNKTVARRVLGSALITIVALALLSAVIIFPILPQVLTIFGSTPEILPGAVTYMKYILIGIPFFATTMVINQTMRAEGKPQIGMTSMVIAAIVNVVLDYILIFPMGMGIEGAAIATMIAQLTGLAVTVGYAFVFKHADVQPQFTRSLTLFFTDVKEIIQLGFPAFFNNIASSLVMIVANNLLRAFGTSDDIAVYSTISKILQFVTMPTFGIASGVQPIAGYNLGAKKFDRIQGVYHLALKVTFVLLVFLAAVIFFFPGQILALFVTDPEFIAFSIQPTRIAFLGIFSLGFSMVSAITLQALQLQKQANIISLLRQILIYVPLSLVLTIVFYLVDPQLAVFGVWIAFPIADVLAAVIAYAITVKALKNLTHTHASVPASELQPAQ